LLRRSREAETVASSDAAGAAAQPDGLERLASFLGTLLDEKRFWAHSKHASAAVRRGLYQVIKAAVRRTPGACAEPARTRKRNA